MNTKQSIINVPLYHVPPGIELTIDVERKFHTAQQDFVLLWPKLTKEKLSAVTEKLLQSRKNSLTKRKTSDIVDCIDAAIQKWLNPNYKYRQWAEALLPLITGYHEEIIRLELKRFLRTFRKKELLRFLDEEFDQAAVLDEFRPRKSGGFSRAYGPSLIFHVFSGNVAGLPIWSLVMGMLVKSANIGKTSSSEPLMAVLFAKSIQEVDPELAESLAILPWKGGTAELEEAAIEASEAIIAYGSSASVEKIRNRVGTDKRFLSYGHKISFGMIGKEALTADHYKPTVHRVAEDVVCYDQQGCLSPHAIFVEEGGVLTARQFAQLLAAELARFQEKKPRAVLSEEESLSIHSVRNQYLFQSLNENTVFVYQSEGGTEWTVIYHEKTGFAASPLNRTIHVFGCSALEEALPELIPYQKYLQSAGLAVNPERLMEMSALLGEAGVNRICAVGQMARTPAGWHHDGRFNLVDLVRWTDVERNVEQLAEQYDPDVE
jgi:hypothetical protein